MLLAEYCLHQLCFAVDELKMLENPTMVAKIVNIFVDIAKLRQLYIRASDDSYMLHERFDILRQFVQGEFAEKRLTRDEVKKIIEYANRTVFKHLGVLQTAFAYKR